MSIQHLLSTGRQALLANQASAERISHNIANATTEGYTRQRIARVTSPSVITPHGHLSSGVMIGGVVRARDAFLDASYRRELSLQERFASVSSGLRQVEAILGEMTDAGVSHAIEAFFDAWKVLSEHPEDSTQRELVRVYGQRVVDQFNNLASKIEAFAGSTQNLVVQIIQEVNTRLATINELNARIVASETGGHAAPDLRDQRDLLLDELAQYVEISVHENVAGAVEVMIGGHVVVDPTSAHPIRLIQHPDGSYDIAYQNSTQGFGRFGGRLGGTLEILTEHVSEVSLRVDALVAAFVDSVNEIHMQGRNANGDTHIPFFDPTGLTAGSMRLSEEVESSVSNIVTGASGEESDVGLALEMARLRYEPLASLGGHTVLSAYTDVAIYVGDRIQGANAMVAAQDTVLATIEMQRSSAHDVSTDEELVQLMQFLQAYAAAAKVLDSASRMFDILMAIA